MLVIPPFPYHTSPDSFDPKKEWEDAWFACPELFFKCTVRPIGGSDTGSEDIDLELMFYRQFPKFSRPLTPGHPLQRAGMEMVYDAFPVPLLYVDYIDRALCRAPLMPVFIGGNETPTIPQSFAKHQRRWFPHGQADKSKQNRGSRIFEVNQFIWNYPRPRPRIGTVEEAEQKRQQNLTARNQKAGLSRRKNKEIAERA
jgi:hypothetical protein